MSKWSDIKMYDLSIPIGISTPPWPTYEPLQVKYFKRLAPNGANGQLVTHSNHVGTHLDGPRHFDTAGRDIAALELTKLCAPGVVVDLSDMAEDFGIYTPEDIEKRVEVREGDILIINTGYQTNQLQHPVHTAWLIPELQYLFLRCRNDAGHPDGFLHDWNGSQAVRLLHSVPDA